MNGISVRGYFADQGAPQAWGKSKQFSTTVSDLFYLVAVNKSGVPVYIELYDTEDGTDLTGLVPRTLPCLDITNGGYVQWTELRMKRGIFVRAVDGASGGALIAGDNVKFDCGYLDRSTG